MADDDNVVSLGGITKLPISVEKVLSSALKEHQENPFDRVIVIGMRGDACTDEYFAGSEADAGTHLYDMERFKFFLMQEAEKRVTQGE